MKASAKKLFQLFPMESFGDVSVNNFNPVEPGRTYFIPGKEKSFLLDEQTGTETIYFLSSRQRDLTLEEQYQMYEEALKRQPEQTDLKWQLEQLDDLLAQADSLQGKSRLVASPKSEAATTTWQEDGQTFSVLQQRLENMCDGCVHVLTFEHR